MITRFNIEERVREWGLREDVWRGNRRREGGSGVPPLNSKHKQSRDGSATVNQICLFPMRENRNFQENLLPFS
jgi:hypothetical protein